MSKNKPRTRQTRIAILAVSVLLFLPLVSVYAAAPLTKKEREQAAKDRDETVSKLDKMYLKYLSGTLMEARTNMTNAISFIHENSARIPELEGALPICYARISFLERKAGREATSKIYFEKARYWQLIEHEKLRLKPEEIAAKLDEFTRDVSDKVALEWDKKYTKGMGPAYLKEVQ